MITLKENETEKVLNGHSIQLTRILRVDESHRLVLRVRQAVTNKFCHVPLLSGSLKDHEEVTNARRDRYGCHGDSRQEDQVPLEVNKVDRHQEPRPLLN